MAQPPPLTQPLAFQAAKCSVWAPVGAFFLNMVTGTSLQDSPIGKIIVGGLGCLLILSGFVAAIYALISIRKYGRTGLLGWGLSGLLINSILIVSALIAIPTLLKITRQKNAYLTEAEAAAFPTLLSGGKVIYNEKTGYRFEIPKDFEDYPDGKTNPKIHYSYRRSNPDGSAIAISIQGLGGTIGKERLKPEHIEAIEKTLPPGAKVSLREAIWQDLQVDVLQTHLSNTGQELTVTACQIPLAREALQINVAGPLEREEEIIDLARQVMQSLHGKSNLR